MSKQTNYAWKYVSLGGVVRVQIDSGEAIAHLDELDPKKWTVLSCPTQGLEFDGVTLSMLDADSDGKIRINEVVDNAKWLTGIIKDNETLLGGSPCLPLEQIDQENPEGAQLYKSARQILSNLGLQKDCISVEEASDSVAIFADSKFNGDGIITPATEKDPELSQTIVDCVNTMGGVMDRSGVLGVDEPMVEAFYTALADYSAWKASASADKDTVFPYGDSTQAAQDACEALKDKISDYFMRCKLIRFDDAVSAAVDINADKVAAISDKNLSTCVDEIASYPLARPSKDRTLPLDGVNPAWQETFNTLKSLVLDSEFPGAESITEEQWGNVLAKLVPFQAWKDARKGAQVEALGLDRINGIIAADKKSALLELIAQDKALEAESTAIDKVNKLVHLYRDFYKFLSNYVILSDFYSLDPDQKAVFQAGELFIDERCCKLCLKVDNMAAHTDMAGLSGMFLIYCTCTSKTLGRTMDIVAVMTAGGIKNLRPGKNAVFYDREGNDWDAVVTKVIDNPINIRQAFFAPYVKFWNFCTEKLNKSAAEKDNAAVANLQSKADNVDVTAEGGAKKPAFDIAKFSGIFAAIGLAIGFITQACVSIAQGIAAISFWQLLLVILAIMLLISGPSCFIAWGKLRRRNLGPVLNANGWAINSAVKVNSVFGSTLTSVAKYPLVKGGDPFKKKTPLWRKILRVIIALVIVAAAVLYFICPCHKKTEAEPATTVEVENVTSAEAELAAEPAQDAVSEE